jgi:hypothetical protein
MEITPIAPSCASAPVCIVCDVAQVTPHTKGSFVSISYPNGFTTCGNKNYECIVCKNEYAIENEAVAIYTALGYAYKLDGSGAIMGGYSINRDALNEWKEYNGSENDTVIFGVLIFNPKNLTEQSTQFIDVQTGEATISKGFVQIEVKSTYQYSTINFKVAGITDQIYSSLEIVFSGYSYIEGDYTGISYIQNGYEDVEKSPIVKQYEKSGISLYSVTAQSIEQVITKK